MKRLVVITAMLVLAAPGEARRDRTTLGDAIRASRMINAYQFEEAAALVAELSKSHPDAAEVRWLAAQLAFHDGRYAEAIDTLRGIADQAVGGEVGQLRQLVTRTMTVTGAHLRKDSPAGHFEITYPDGDDQVIVDLAGEALDRAWETIGTDLGLKPKRKIRVEILAKPEELAMVSTLTEQEIETTGTIALSKYGKLMVVSPRATMFGYPWMDTLAHEYTHLLVAELSRDAVPVWLQEGLARHEQSRWRAAAAEPLSASDRQLLGNAVANRRLIDLDDMHPSMAKLPSQEAAALAYAEVFTLVGWMHGKIGYPGLRAIIAAQRDGKSARRAVSEAMGASWGDVERAWKAHLGSLDLGTTAKAVAKKPIRFVKGGVANENVGVEEIAGAKARRHARLGGMLRSHGMRDAAALEYEKALAASPDNGFVASKLARTYVELGRHARAIEIATPLAAGDPNDASLAVTLGMAHVAAGDLAAARDAFEQALRTSPFDPQVRCGLADSYRTLGDDRAAREQAACTRLRR